jgi:hypothetical protein
MDKSRANGLPTWFHSQSQIHQRAIPYISFSKQNAAYDTAYGAVLNLERHDV